MKICKYQECENDISHLHRNTKYCSDSCLNKQRYLEHGQRITPERRQELYKIRVQNNDYRESLNEKARDRSYKLKTFLADFKIKQGCKDCGYNLHHVALDFDHITDDKSFNLAEAKSISAAKKEILKCEVVCSNCHRIRTYERLQKEKT